MPDLAAAAEAVVGLAAALGPAQSCACALAAVCLGQLAMGSGRPAGVQVVRSRIQMHPVRGPVE